MAIKFLGLFFFILYDNSDNNFLTLFDLKNNTLFFKPSNFIIDPMNILVIGLAYC